MDFQLSWSYMEAPAVVGTQLILQHTPSPAFTLQFFRNGLLQNPATDFALSGNFIVPNPAPAPGDVFLCNYRW